ncbi:unnamed protein product [Moneuplotes crassus]|uniref:Uncharacterized protein n=1 Tax=Euplotes crassus TaxID=5936 RepID=A0AAD1XEF5_EUPCR|nr:unnamed protein product [Moneuplotes crassus]
MYCATTFHFNNIPLSFVIEYLLRLDQRDVRETNNQRMRSFANKCCNFGTLYS